MPIRSTIMQLLNATHNGIRMHLMPRLVVAQTRPAPLPMHLARGYVHPIQKYRVRIVHSHINHLLLQKRMIRHIRKDIMRL
jgi:hypothetical protein